MKLLCTYAPSFVVFAWAGLIAAGVRGPAVAVPALVALGAALALHIRQERQARRRGRVA